MKKVEGGGTPLSGHSFLPVDTEAGNSSNKIVTGRPDSIRHWTGGLVPLYCDKAKLSLNTCPQTTGLGFLIIKYRLLVMVHHHHHQGWLAFLFCFDLTQKKKYIWVSASTTDDSLCVVTVALQIQTKRAMDAGQSRNG